MADEAVQRRTRNLQSGPRSRAVIEAVRAAVAAELDRLGFAGMTMDGVARTAGINRTTLYRRWPTKVALLAELLEAEIDRLEHAELPEGLDPALREVVAGLAENLSRREGVALARAFTAPEPELRGLAETARLRALMRLRVPFARARANGEIAADADIDMLAHMLFSGAVLWALDAPLDGAAQQRLVTLALRAAGQA
ncbi:MAG: TetR family transcriptional regulator [Devosia sp.]|uniref:TetR/AcrR family transcriptional regulator n=1 Tax=Devosia sp. TaxID=1871048 RepID=UPI0024C5B530|nr:TetR family transcriptional regulator [Devosia sp.]UYN99119.1 MAG: TetR family transcriptional regulator [Devosia sp.]